jgi:uncharacterized protein (DUF3820 family)
MKNNEIFEMPFGKYKGMSLGEIYAENKGYLEWVLQEFDRGSEIYAQVENFMDEVEEQESGRHS